MVSTDIVQEKNVLRGLKFKKRVAVVGKVSIIIMPDDCESKLQTMEL